MPVRIEPSPSFIAALGVWSKEPTTILTRGAALAQALHSTYRSSLSQVERFFALVIDQAIPRGSFTSVQQLVERIDHFVTANYTNCQPFK